MIEKTLRILEYDKIVQKLSSLAASELGKELAGTISPEKSRSKVESLLKETNDGVSFIMRRGSPPLGGIHDIRTALKRADMGAVLNPGELLSIADTIRASRNLKTYSTEDNITESDNTVRDLINCLETHKKIEDKIRFSIVSEDEIADTASTTLANVRRQMRDAQNSIKDKLNDIVKSSKYQKYMQDAIVTIRGDRYVVPVKQEYRSEIPGLVHDSSSSGATIFVEPMAVVEANNNIRQLKNKEQIEIERILYELTSDIAGVSTSLKSNISLLAKLDFIFAKARLSIDYNCIYPKMSEKRKMVIKRGRHPLLDQKNVVPIDFWIGDDFSTMVITGPNTGGKTVTLKTVGLFTLMFQSGLNIPAGDGTEMCIFDKVFADIGDEQSIEQSLSTFSSHMRNIVDILKQVDDNSLVLFDELGAGTDPTEGAALAMSVLECLHQSGAVTVATTHYSELKVFAMTTPGLKNACCEFDVETLKPTYRLLIGIPGKSNAFAISGKLGLSSGIIERAREFLTQEDVKFEDMLMNIQKNLSESEKERIKGESYRIEIEKMKNELEAQKEKYNLQKEKYLREAKEEARRILLNAKTDADEILKKMRQVEADKENADRNKASEEIRLRLKGKIDEVEQSLADTLMPRKGYVKPPKSLKPGDSVLIVNLNQKGTVITPPGDNGEAVIQAGIMKINVHITNLRVIDEQKKEIHKTGSGKIGLSKSSNISTEIDLRGSSLEEALDTVDKYLDDASLAGLGEVFIIHGKGTGVLRSGIHQHLKSNRHVKSYRLGRYGEGESGVTLVELK